MRYINPRFAYLLTVGVNNDDDELSWKMSHVRKRFITTTLQLMN